MKKSSQIVVSTNDVSAKILLRLPFKPLIRFELVSKQWLSLITDPNFCRRYNSKPNQAIGIFVPHRYTHNRYDFIPFFPHVSKDIPSLNFNLTLMPSKTEVVTLNEQHIQDESLRFFCPRSKVDPSLKIDPQPFYLAILDCCNGLLLCYGTSPMRRDDPRVTDRDYYTLYVYSPTTNRCRLIPRMNREHTRSVFAKAVLALDPGKSPHYNIVYVDSARENGDVSKYQVHVYASESRTWSIPAETRRVHAYSRGVFRDGCVHWICHKENSLRFIIDKQLLVDMPSPPNLPFSASDTICYFGQSNGHLHYIYEKSKGMSFVVYEMKKDYSEWFVIYQVDLSTLDIVLER